MNLEQLLDSLDIRFNPDRTADQDIRCPWPDHDDRRASARLNLGKGVVFCHGCGRGGDAVNLIAELEGISIKEALQRAGQEPQSRQPRKGRGYKFKMKRKGVQW